MKTHLDIYDVKIPQEHDEHGENSEKHNFRDLCPQLVTEIVGVSITCH